MVKQLKTNANLMDYITLKCYSCGDTQVSKIPLSKSNYSEFFKPVTFMYYPDASFYY